MGRTVTLLLLIWVALAPFASAQPTFVNGQAARAVIGQPTFTRQAPTSSRDTIGGAAGIAVVGNRLFIADGNEAGATPLNNRLLIYNDLSSFLPRPDEELPEPDENFCPVCGGQADTVLGQTDFDSIGPGRPTGFQNVTAVHSDGTTLAVADTDNNRVLIWRTIPTMNGTLPDVVVGQPDFENGFPRTTADGMRGPQGVWIDSGRLFVADTLNGRVLIYNSIPSTNGVAADIVLGQPDFNTRPEPDLTQSNLDINASTMLDPVAVTVTNGQMFVTDLGFSRVVIYFSIPTQSFFPADVVIGQIDFETSIANDSTQLCEESDPPTPSNVDDDIFFFPDEDCTVSEQTEMSCTDMMDNDCDGRTDRVDADCCVVTEETEVSCGDGIDNDCDGMVDFFNDDDCGPAFPGRCGATLHFPRFALSDGEKLYISDSGNDRVLIFNEIPRQNGASADIVLGQQNFEDIEESTGAASLRAPGALALDDENLYVTDPFTRRVLVFTPAEDQIAQDGLVNAAAFQIPANGSVFLTGDLAEGQRTTVAVGPRQYQHVAVEGDSAPQAVDSIVEQINADPFAVATAAPAVSGGEHASGALTFDGEVRVGDQVTLSVGNESYTVEAQEGDEPFVMVDRFVNEIGQNGDSMIFALRDTAGDVLNRLRFVYRDIGPVGNGIPYSFSVSPGSPLTVEPEGESLAGGDRNFGFRVFAKEPGTAGNRITLSSATALGGTSTAPSRSGQQLTGGSDARELPVGTIAAVFGQGFSDQTWLAESADPSLPTELGGVRVYVNGVVAPLFTVTPEQINFLVPFEMTGTTISVYVWRRHDDGTVTVSAPRAAPIGRASPGLFAFPGPEPRQAIAVHATGVAQGRIAITQVRTGLDSNGNPLTITPGVTLSITIQGRQYSHVTVDGDTPTSVRDALVAVINGAPDPDVVASSAVEGFFSARADVVLSGEIQAGDRLTITINGRPYVVVVQEDDTIASVRNKMVDEINSGSGDLETTARRLAGFDPATATLQVVARSLGDDGNDISFSVATSEGALLVAETNVVDDDDDTVDGFLRGGQTPPVVLLTSRFTGREANEITFSAESSDTAIANITTRTNTLCCGNDPFSLVTPENPAAPGEIITLFGTGLGQTAPNPQDLGIQSGQPTPAGQLLNVPFNADDFVSSLADGRAPVILFTGLMPGQVGVYQINLRLNEGHEDNPATPIDIRQVVFFSNLVTIPIKNIRPRDDAF